MLLDSGVRRGSDVVKALALGAPRSTSAARSSGPSPPPAKRASKRSCKMILADLDLTMALCGYTEPGQIGPEALA